MDRYDIAQFDFRQLQMMLTFRSGGIAVAIYIITLIITLVSTRYDDKLSLHRVNETIYEDLDQEVLSSEISIWKALNLCRSIGVILGWFLISMRPKASMYSTSKIGVIVQFHLCICHNKASWQATKCCQTILENATTYLKPTKF